LPGRRALSGPSQHNRMNAMETNRRIFA
jgi:hypothetical protein